MRRSSCSWFWLCDDEHYMKGVSEESCYLMGAAEAESAPRTTVTAKMSEV